MGNGMTTQNLDQASVGQPVSQPTICSRSIKQVGLLYQLMTTDQRPMTAGRSAAMNLFHFSMDFSFMTLVMTLPLSSEDAPGTFLNSRYGAVIET